MFYCKTEICLVWCKFLKRHKNKYIGVSSQHSKMAIEVQPLGVKRIKYGEQELTHYLKPRC